jgi:hypothetical protein
MVPLEVWFTQCFSLTYACTKRKKIDEFGKQLYKCHLKKCTYNFKLVVLFGRLQQFGKDNQWSYNVGCMGGGGRHGTWWSIRVPLLTTTNSLRVIMLSQNELL